MPTTATSSRTTAGATSVEERGLRARRALGLVVLSVVLPGSGQYVAGNRAVGRWAIRIWLSILALVVLTGLGLLVARDFTVGLALAVAPALRPVAWLLFLGWVALLVDAWRLARPLRLGRQARLVLTGSCLALIVAAGLGTSLVASALTAAGNLGDVFQGGGDGEQKAGRYNILLLGVDSAATREGLRPDSINVASVDAATGRTVLFGLPRNLQRAPFPDGSPLYALYPDGYVCDDGACMLNGIYTLGQEHADLYPGKEAGLEATKEVVSEVLGIELNYYAMIDMGGFKSIVEAMGGITLDSNRRVPIGGGSSEVHGYIEPGDDIHLDGYHALWYARSRHDSNDYERMIRQKCVMSAMAKQLDPMTVATKFEELSRAGKDLLRTDVGTDRVASLAELALKGRSLDISTVNFAPPLIVTAHPDLVLIRATVAESIAAAEALDGDAPAQPSTPTAAASTAPPKPTASPRTTKEPSERATASAKASPSATPAEWICRAN